MRLLLFSVLFPPLCFVAALACQVARRVVSKLYANLVLAVSALEVRVR
jgi:hypothetical protein